jgi:NADPH-dependent 2,4-dienoyl-CoA reductase/sulfur reductase-like enzyme
MARRLTLEGAEVLGVYEVKPTPSGLTRNIHQCLHDYDIPLHLSTTVAKVHGKKRIEAVTVAKLDENRQIIPGTEEYIECDLLVLAVGLIPENELSVGCGIELDERTRGPILDNHFMTSVPGIFACGNVAVVFDLVDYVSQSGEIAAKGAVAYMNGKLTGGEGAEYVRTVPAGNVNFIVPQKIVKGEECEVQLYMRVKHPDKKAVLEVSEDGQVTQTARHAFVAPPEMISCGVKATGNADVVVDMKEGK